MAIKYRSIRELRPTLPSIVRDVATTYARYIVTRRGKPEAVILGLDDYERLLDAVSAAKHKHLRELLREGYVEMAAEARVITRAFEALDRDALTHAD